MAHFVRGVLERNDNGATYGGRVYDRILSLRHISGVVLTVFDMQEPISTGIATGQTYEMIFVQTLPGSVQYIPAIQLAASKSELDGIIVDSHWRPPKVEYLRVRPALYERGWMLLNTAYGQVLMNADEIGAPRNVGDNIRTIDSRWDLYAIMGQ